MWQTMSGEEELVDSCKNERQQITIYHINVNNCSLVRRIKITFF